jgi:hypothetical protein
MKYSFYNPDQITMEAETDNDAELLTYLVDSRARAFYVARSWQSEAGLDKERIYAPYPRQDDPHLRSLQGLGEPEVCQVNFCPLWLNGMTLEEVK